MLSPPKRSPAGAPDEAAWEPDAAESAYSQITLQPSGSIPGFFISLGLIEGRHAPRSGWCTCADSTESDSRFSEAQARLCHDIGQDDKRMLEFRTSDL